MFVPERDALRFCTSDQAYSHSSAALYNEEWTSATNKHLMFRYPRSTIEASIIPIPPSGYPHKTTKFDTPSYIFPQHNELTVSIHPSISSTQYWNSKGLHHRSTHLDPSKQLTPEGKRADIHLGMMVMAWHLEQALVMPLVTQLVWRCCQNGLDGCLRRSRGWQ